MCSLSTECSKLKKIQKANWRSHNGPRPILRVNFLLLIRMASEYDFGKEMHVHTGDMQSPPVMHRDQRDFAIQLLSASCCAPTPLQNLRGLLLASLHSLLSAPWQILLCNHPYTSQEAFQATWCRAWMKEQDLWICKTNPTNRYVCATDWGNRQALQLHNHSSFRCCKGKHLEYP